MLEKVTFSSKRFNPYKAGVKILKLSYQNVKITQKVTDIIELLSRLVKPIKKPILCHAAIGYYPVEIGSFATKLLL